MKLTEKLKKFRNAALLSAAISTSFVGCATPWQTVRQEQKPTGIERQVLLETTPEKEEEITFNISDPYIEEGEHEVQITNSLEEFNFDVRIIGTEREFGRFLIEERNYIRVGAAATAMAFSFGAAGILSVGGFGLMEGIDDWFVYGAIAGLGGGALGAITGAAISPFSPIFNTKETRLTETGEFAFGPSSFRTTETVPGEDVIVYQDEPASNISVRLSGEGRYGMRRTNNEGELNLSRFVDTLNPQYFFRNYTDSQLQERIEGISLVQQIKPRTLENLMDDLLQAFSPTEVRLTASTQEESSEGREVRNDSQTFNMEGNEITDEAIYGIVRQFVDEEINSNIKSLSFLVRDNVSHVPIESSNFEFTLNAPRREDLAGEYFTQHLKDYAERYINDYIEESAIISDVPSRVLCYIYTPSIIQLEITHPDYHFVDGVVVMENENLEKEVYMVDKGEKIRVEDADNERGRIE